MSTFGSGSTTTAGASITLRAFTGTDGQTAGSDGLVPGPAIAQQGYVLGASGDWTLNVLEINDFNDATNRIATTAFVQNRVAQILAGGGGIVLGGLQDVDLAGLADGDFIRYSLADLEWQTHTLTIGSISDVNLAGLQVGNTIVWDGAEWVPGVGGGGGAADLNELGDVTIAGVADKHFLVNNGAGQFVNRLISSGDLSDTANITLADGSVAFTGNVDLGANNLTNVGDLSASTITIVDNSANSFVIKEGGNNYLRFNTINNSESIIFEKTTVFNQRVDFNNTVVVNEAGNGIDFRVETGTQTHAIFTDGAADRIGIFQNNPQVPLDIVGNTKITGGLEITGTITSDDLLEKARDAAGTALANGVHTNITFVNDDANNRINATVTLASTDLTDSNLLARLDDPDLTGTPTAPTALIAVENTQIATTAFVHALIDSDIAGLGLGTASTQNIGDFLASNADINDLGGISTAGKGEGKILKFNAQNNLVVAEDEGKTQEEIEDIVGGMVDGNTETGISVTYQAADNTLDFEVDNTTVGFLGGVQTFTGNKTFSGSLITTGDTDLTGANFVRVPIPVGGTDATTKNYVDTEVSGKQDSNARLTDISGLGVNANNFIVGDGANLTLKTPTDAITSLGMGVALNDLLIGSGANTFGKIATTVGSRSFLASNANVADLADGGTVVKTDSDATVGANEYDFTAATFLRVKAPVAGSDATTKTYVDAEVATKQASNTNLTSISGLNIVDGSMIIGDGNNSFEILTIQGGVENFLKSTGRVAALSDVTVNNEALNNANHILVSTGAGGFESQTISTTNLSNSGDIVLETADATFGANTYDFTAATAITVPAPNNATDATTKTYVDTEVGGKQDSDATLSGLALLAPVDNDLIIATGNDTFGVINTSAGVQTFLASDGSLDGINNVTIAGNLGQALADGQVLRYDGANTEWKNSKIAFGDLADVASTQNVALLNGNQTFSGNNTFTADVDLTGAVVTATTQQNADDSTKVATTAFVKAIVNQVGNVSDLDDLTDVNIGVKVLQVDGENVNDGVALANAQILVYDSDGGLNDTSWKNVSLSGDVTITNAGVSTIQAGAITLAKNAIIENGAITNAKLANSYVAITDGTATDNLPLGQTLTFNNVANETTVEVAADQGGGADGVAITIGLPDDVTIGQDLTVSRNLQVDGDLTVNGTTTTVSTEQLTIEDPVVVLNSGDAANDVGYFFTNPGAAGDQIFIFDNTDQIFKMAQVPAGKGAGDGEDSNFNPTVYSGLKIAALTATTGSFSGLLNADGGIEIDNNGNKFTVSNAGAVVSVGGITDTTTASAFASNTTIGNLTLADGSITDSGGSIDFGDENLSTSGNLTINTDKFIVTGATGNLAINTNKFTVTGATGDLAINTNKFTVAGATGNTLVAGTLDVTLGATFTAGLSANDQNITSVADISLDSISAAGDAIAIVLDDKVASALVIREGANDYITVDTTDNAELITFEKNVQFNGTTNITPDYDQAITINESGNDVDFRVEGSGQTHLLFTDGGNNRVGINNNAPATQLHVIGDNTFEGAITHNSGSVVFNSDAENFDFNVKGDTEANLFYVDASADMIGIGKNNPSKVLDITGDVGISSTLDVTGKTTLAGSLDLTTGSNTGITFRSEIADQGADANQTLLRVNTGGGGPVYKSIKWVAASDLFEVESGLKSTGNFTVGADKATFNATTGAVGLTGTTTINNADGTADLIVQDNGVDVFNVDASTGITTITGQLKTDDLRAKTAGTDNFKVVLEDGIANALEIYDDSIANESYLLFNTQGEKMDFGKEVNFNSRANFITSLSLQSGVNSGVKYNSNLENAVSQDATLMTIEGGTNKSDVVLRWDTSEDEINLNSEAILHIQGKNLDSALTIGGATGQAANITMTTAGAITLAGTLDSPTINTNKITNKNDTSLVVELADTEPSALVIREGNNGESYLTIDTDALTTTLNQATSFSSTVDITGDATLDASLKIKYIDGLTTPLILANSDRTGNGDEADALLIEVERGEEANAKIKWDETSNVFEFDKTLSAEANFQVGLDAAAPKATINSTTGNLSTDGTISATSSITTDSVLNFTGASQGAIVFNSDLAVDVAPANTDDFGLTVNRGNATSAKLYWDESATSWQFETGNVLVQNTIVADSDAANKVEIAAGSITTADDSGINFGADSLTTTGSITGQKPANRVEDSTVVPTTSWVLDLRLGDFDQVDTTGFNANDQVLVWDQDNSNFKAGTAVYGAENARDDVGAALVKGSIINGVLNDVNGASTGADTISFTLDDANDIINLALGISSGNLTDISTDAPANNQVLRYTTAEGANQNKYVPTTLGTSADVDTGLNNGEIPTLTTHYLANQSETADLILTGRVIETIDYGAVSEAFDAATDYAIDFGSVTDTVLYGAEDYGMLVV